MLRSTRPAPIPSRFSATNPQFFCAAFLAAAPSAHARLIFADYQVLPADRTVDVLVWMAPDDPARPAFTRLEPYPAPVPGDSSPAPAGDSLSSPEGAPSLPPSADGSACAPAGETWKISSCRVSDPNPHAGPREGYLYWAFLNLGSTTQRGDLTAREKHHRTLDALTRPFVAFRRRKDSCEYLVLHKDSYAPAAAGRLACPDLATALSGLESDLAGRMNRSNLLKVSREEKIVRSHGSPFRDRPQVLEVGADAMVAAAIMLSGDTEDQQDPFPVSREVFDLEDMAALAVPPLACKVFLLYRRLVGFRIGYEYTRLALEDEVMSSLRSEIMAAYGSRLDDWRIRRHTLSGELLLGMDIPGRNARGYLGGLLGLAHINYSETATVDGKDDDVPGFLKDVTGLLLGAQARILFLDLVQIGAEAGLCFKNFAMRTTGEQPDGSASELQFRLSLGLQKTFRLDPKSE